MLWVALCIQGLDTQTNNQQPDRNKTDDYLLQLKAAELDGDPHHKSMDSQSFPERCERDTQTLQRENTGSKTHVLSLDSLTL